ncbi:MAG: hypothetical protein J7L21_00405 [Sulfurimonas sp.]|nr:hypothetical protein [Sulfurimonas sp.]
MKDFHDIVKELKLYLAQSENVKVYDKDVANILGITQMNFATMKRRNTTPYASILKFCKRERLCCNKIFFN